MNIIATITAIGIIATPALADLPSAHTWPMEHITVSMTDNALHAHTSTDATNPVEMRRFAGQTYDGNAAHLNDMFYSDQYGWVLDGIVNPGDGNSIWIELTSQSEGLESYEGGRRMMIPEQTFDPIFGTDDSPNAWQWSGAMTHHWYAVETEGDYQATYSLYVGDSAGNRVAGFQEASVTLSLRAVPAPAPLALLAMGATRVTRRKRG